jgi:hypothetical protein
MNTYRKHPGMKSTANSREKDSGKKLPRPGHEVYRDEKKPGKKHDTFCLTCGLKNCRKLSYCRRAKLEK